MSKAHQHNNSPKALRRQAVVGIVLLACVLLVGFWEIMANRSRRPWKAFELTADDFGDWIPEIEGWRVERVPVETTALEPNIVAFMLSPVSVVQGSRLKLEGSRSETVPGSSLTQVSGLSPQPSTVVVRLVHGYNTVDCLRIKGYVVEEMGDMMQGTSETGEGQRTQDSSQSDSGVRSRPSALPLIQLWKVTSTVGDVSIWATSILRASDFAGTDMDVRDMAFPRVGTPDDPDWNPQGLTVKSLKHPIRNFRLLLRAKWNGARCDLATFLKLRQPAWADDRRLTLVSVVNMKKDMQGVEDQVVEAHGTMHRELVEWREGKGSTR